MIDPGKMWRRLRPHYTSPAGRSISRICMEICAKSRASQYGFEYKQHPPEAWRPVDYESCDWRLSAGVSRRRGWYDFVCHGACHWTAPIHLHALSAIEDGWRIYSSEDHTHCRHRDGRVYDPQAWALGYDPFELMCGDPHVLSMLEWLAQHCAG